MADQSLRHVLYVKGLVDSEPDEKRIEIYRWLASVCDDSWTSKQLLKLAAELEKARHLSQQIDLQLPSPNNDGDGHHKKGDGK